MCVYIYKHTHAHINTYINCSLLHPTPELLHIMRTTTVTWPVSLDLWLDLQVRKVGALGEKRALVRQPRQQPVPGEGTATGEAGLSPRDKGRRSTALRFGHMVFQHLGIFSCFWVRAVNLPSWNLNEVQNKLLNKGILCSPGLYSIPLRGMSQDPSLTTFPAEPHRAPYLGLPSAPSR